MLLYYTRGGLQWVGGVQYGDLGALKAEGLARLVPPKNPGYASTGYCMLAVCYMESGVVDVSTVAEVREQQGACSCFAACVLHLYLGCCVAPIGDALAFCLLLCCCVAMPCPFTRGEQAGQRPSPLPMLKLCSCQCPHSLVGRYPRSSGSAFMLWATSGSPGTRGIEQGRNHLSVRDAR